MHSSTITIDNNGNGITQALTESENFSRSLNLSPKDSFHIRLLTEEVMEMLKSILGEFRASFRLESDDKSCILHLNVEADMNYSQRQNLLSFSTEGANSAPQSIMDRVKELITGGLYGMVDESVQAGAGVVSVWDAKTEGLDKYIIGSIADEVSVGISKGKAQLIIKRSNLS